MAEDRNSTSDEGVEHGVLDEVSTSTTAIDLGATAQVNVILPVGYRDDDRDDDVIADELSAEEIARQERDPDALHDQAGFGDGAADSNEHEGGADELANADGVESDDPSDADEADSDETGESGDTEKVESDDQGGPGEVDPDEAGDADEVDPGALDADAPEAGDDNAEIDSDEDVAGAASDGEHADSHGSRPDDGDPEDGDPEDGEPADADEEASAIEDADDADATEAIPAPETPNASGAAEPEEDADHIEAPQGALGAGDDLDRVSGGTTDATDPSAGPAHEDDAEEDVAEANGAPKRDDFAGHIDDLLATAAPSVSLVDPATEPEAAILREAATTKEPLMVKDPSPIPAAVSEETAARVEEAARTGRPSFIKSHARSAGEAGHSAAPEESAVLTDARLLETGAIRKPAPVDPWRRVIHSMTGGLINLGNSKATRERYAVKARITARIEGRARFVPVVSRKGGVGKTTVTALLGMALADARDDRVVAVDANPDRGTLAERIAKPSGKTVRDLVRDSDQIRGYGDMSAHVTRDETRLDVLASDADPHVADAFSDADYRAVAEIAQHYYSLVLTDTGTGIVHSVMSATLDLADQLVIVSGVSIDEARLAAETLSWLEANGRAELARNAIVVINQEAAGKTHVRIDEVESHFRTRVRDVVRIPFDPAIATGSAISFHELAQPTRDAARNLAALVVEGIRA